VRIATWNVNSVTARLPRLVDWLEQAAPDVACLQETKVSDDAFPAGSVTPLGYEVASHGTGRWNGVAVLSRVGLTDVVRGLPGDPGFPDPGTPEARTLAATCGPVRVRSVYVPNGRAPDDPHYAYKLRWLAALTGESTVTVYTNGNLQVINKTALAVGDAARFNGFLFKVNGKLVLFADVQADGPGQAIGPH